MVIQRSQQKKREAQDFHFEKWCARRPNLGLVGRRLRFLNRRCDALMFGRSTRRMAKRRSRGQSRNVGKKWCARRAFFRLSNRPQKKPIFNVSSSILARYSTTPAESRSAFFGEIAGKFHLLWGKNGEDFSSVNQPPQTGSQTVVPVNSRCKNIAFSAVFSTQMGKFAGKKQKIYNRMNTIVLLKNTPD